MIKKYTFLFCLLYLTSLFCQAQKPDLEDEAVLRDLLLMESSSLDPEAKALEVYHKGRAEVVHFSSKYKEEVIYKVFSGEVAADVGTIFIPNTRNILLKNLKATVYNLENGKIRSKSIGQNDLLKERISDGMRIIKVYLPEVKKGSVIAYQYERESGNLDLLRTSWDFQGPYPSLHSEYEANIPGYISYDPIVRINSELVNSKNKKELEQPGNAVVYREGVAEVAISSNVWIRRNVPSFKPETYMSSPDNYRERVRLHIKAFSAGGNIFNVNFKWDEICEKQYYKNDFFIKPAFGRNNFLSETVGQLTEGAATAKDQARAIYNFVRDSTERYSGADANSIIKLKDIFQKRSGSNYELNLLLVAMLRNAKLDAYPVLLSTTQNERLNHYYPEPDDINYMVTFLKIGRDSFYLDPSRKFLAFGVLPPYCLNGYSRIISQKGGHTELQPQQFKDHSTIMVALQEDDEHENQQAKIDVKYGWISSYNLRQSLGADTALLREFIEKQIDGGYRITSIASNLNDYNDRLLVTYEIARPGAAAPLIYFNPYIEKVIDDNPFPAITRRYPVELPYLRDIQYVLKYQLPKGFMLEEGSGKEKKWLLNEAGDLSFISKIAYAEDINELTVYTRYSENNSYIPAESYDFLRAFYEKIIEEQNEKLVLKKM